jgi:two-component system, NarL family, nitrate/nitrite response regulator NarL
MSPSSAFMAPSSHAQRPIDVLVVDDHTLFRRGLIALLSQDTRFRVACEAGDVGEALRCLHQYRPDVILLDNHMPGVRGIDGIPALREAAPSVRIMMLTVSESEEDLVAALRAGADGYLLKTSESDALCDSILKVMAGDSVVSPEMTAKMVAALRGGLPLQRPSSPLSAAPASALPLPVASPSASAQAPGDELSHRERDILRLIARGESNKAIARGLDIAETTVKIHVQHILRKLNLSSRVQIAVYAVSHGLQ